MSEVDRQTQRLTSGRDPTAAARSGSRRTWPTGRPSRPNATSNAPPPSAGATAHRSLMAASLPPLTDTPSSPARPEAPPTLGTGRLAPSASYGGPVLKLKASSPVCTAQPLLLPSRGWLVHKVALEGGDQSSGERLDSCGGRPI